MPVALGTKCFRIGPAQLYRRKKVAISSVLHFPHSERTRKTNSCIKDNAQELQDQPNAYHAGSLCFFISNKKISALRVIFAALPLIVFDVQKKKKNKTFELIRF